MWENASGRTLVCAEMESWVAHHKFPAAKVRPFLSPIAQGLGMKGSTLNPKPGYRCFLGPKPRGLEPSYRYILGTEP